MAVVTDFCLLGPLLVRSGGAAVPVRQGKQRVVLAALLLSAGKVVSLEDLAEILWGAEPPPSARVTTQNYVMRLRRALADMDSSRIRTQPHGYLIRVDPDELDVARFESLLAEAREATRVNSWDTAAIQSRAALLLWRGEPLSDVDSDVLAAREVPRLAELRLQALEVRIGADLHLGRHTEVIAELQQLVAGHPLRERLHGLLMLALYRDGRQAEALAVYQEARRVLVDELGTDPGTRLRELHHQILAADPALQLPGTKRAALDGPERIGLRQLPATARHFTGRAPELAELSGFLDQADQEKPGTAVIFAIGGTAGVGKTALAVHWAHRVAYRFPDGHLYVNLRGYDSGQLVSATDALAMFLRVLGVNGEDIPRDEDERAARYRSILAGRRMLVVLDNAVSSEQVRPLLPGTPACTVLVTSRDALAGLAARDGAHRLTLDLLSLDDAVRLLRRLIGDRADADLEVAAALAGQCCRLPLALRIAAELAVGRPDDSLADLTGELADQHRRLDLLDADGDPGTAMRAVFSWSYRRLDADVACAFRLLGLHPGSDFDPYAAAALTGTSFERATQLLDALARAHLIEPVGQGRRYGMHDLLRAYARELTAEQELPPVRREAVGRLADYYLYTAATAIDTMFPAESDRRPRIPPPATSSPAVTTIDAARNWLDTERATLVALAAHTAADGWPSHAIRLSIILFRYLQTGGHYTEVIAIQDHARRAARVTGDRAAEAEALQGLTVIDLRQGRHRQAADRIQQALSLYRETGNQAGQARALGNLGIAGFLQGRYQEATRHLQQAVAVYRETGNQAGEARHLNNLGLVELRMGSYRQAGQHLDQALIICRQIGNQSDEAYALSNLGVISLRLGNHQQASEHLDQALTICRETGNRDCEAYALNNLGMVRSGLGDHRRASEHLDQALTICRETGDRASEAEALNSLAEILLADGRRADAQARQAIALELASQIDDKYEKARAHDGLARGYHASGDLGRARRHWQQALALYTSLGTPEAHHVRADLAAATGDHGDHEP
jgi:DNA-binding SARP family transcriptional activator/Tfp pilus assembly protein PilF